MAGCLRKDCMVGAASQNNGRDFGTRESNAAAR